MEAGTAGRAHRVFPGQGRGGAHRQPGGTLAAAEPRRRADFQLPERDAPGGQVREEPAGPHRRGEVPGVRAGLPAVRSVSDRPPGGAGDASPASGRPAGSPSRPCPPAEKRDGRYRGRHPDFPGFVGGPGFPGKDRRIGGLHVPGPPDRGGQPASPGNRSPGAIR